MSTDVLPRQAFRDVVERFAVVPSLRAKYAAWLADGTGELSDLPILDKEEFAVALGELTAGDAGVRAGAYTFASGGTMSAPKLSLLPDSMFVADILAQWNPLTPDDVVVNLYTPGRLWSAHYFYNAFALAAGAAVIPFGPLADEEIDEWFGFFEKQGMTCIAATPSTIRQVVGRCAELGRGLSGLRKLMWVGESYDAETAELVRKHLPGVQVWGNYGSTETWVIGWNTPDCPDDTFHVLPYQHVECVDGAIVVTNTHPRCVNPLVRYAVGDRGTPTVCGCGRPQPAVRVGGRTDSYFKFLNQLVSPEEIVGLARELPEVAAAQLVLRQAGTGDESLELRIRPSGLAAVSIADRVRRQVLTRHLELGYVVSSMPERFRVVIVEQLERLPRTGKTPTFITVRSR